MNDPALKHDTRLPHRVLSPPAHLSEAARRYLVPQQTPAYPELTDKAAWAAYIEQQNTAILPFFSGINETQVSRVDDRRVNGARVYDVYPHGPVSAGRGIVLDLHGGALILCEGAVCRLTAIAAAARLGQRVWSVDYRTPVAHPYPAALDDCVAAYRGLLEERSPDDIIVSGTSAGGNLAAALLLRARDEGLPVPAGLILNTPEIDLTESGDSFQTHDGIDPLLHSLMPVNRLYANGHDLAHPYLSPLFGDLKGFPPTLLTTGTRDLYLSNTVRMHRALREAHIAAQLHVMEAGPHTGFPGAPENACIDREIRQFIEQTFKRR